MAITRVFKSGNSQAVRIPKELQFDTKEVEIVKRGDELVIRKPLSYGQRVLQAFSGFSEDFFKNGRQQPKMQKRKLRL